MTIIHEQNINDECEYRNYQNILKTQKTIIFYL